MLLQKGLHNSLFWPSIHAPDPFCHFGAPPQSGVCAIRHPCQVFFQKDRWVFDDEEEDEEEASSVESPLLTGRFETDSVQVFSAPSESTAKIPRFDGAGDGPGKVVPFHTCKSISPHSPQRCLMFHRNSNPARPFWAPQSFSLGFWHRRKVRSWVAFQICPPLSRPSEWRHRRCVTLAGAATA